MVVVRFSFIFGLKKKKATRGSRKEVLGSASRVPENIHMFLEMYGGVLVGMIVTER